ncbi:MAG: uracil-DNA glycosylase [Nanoarchaeota archaeon]|nr:uracil-DNA glycosylase [Nanoarchaeota archaeon]
MKINQKEQAMQELSKQINSCEKCELYKTRNKPLVGDGSANAKILAIGESPGYYEDIENKAFAGEAGKILNQLLDSIGLKRSDIYITNVLKCHPPRNHNPNRQEIDSCISYLHKQIDIMKPKLIITLGKFASREIFAKYNLEFTRISEIRGKVFEIETLESRLKIIPLLHPAVACYHSEMINVLKDDFKKLGNVLNNNAEKQN